jgi:acetoin utilization protein AcuB
MLVRDRMSSPAVTVRVEDDYKTALELMQGKALHHLPVVDAKGEVVGIAAARDLLIAADKYLQADVEVGEIMHKGAITLTPDMPIAEAARLMLRNKIGSLPVVDAAHGLVGMITESDIFRAFVDLSAQT